MLDEMRGGVSWAQRDRPPRRTPPRMANSPKLLRPAASLAVLGVAVLFAWAVPVSVAYGTKRPAQLSRGDKVKLMSHLRQVVSRQPSAVFSRRFLTTAALVGF